MARDDEISDEFESVYNDEGRQELVDDDEISPEEEAFMAGYDSSEEEKSKEDDSDEVYERAFDSADSKKGK